MLHQPDPPAGHRWVVPMLLCAVLLMGFAALSYTAGRTKSATFDEPLHLVGGLTIKSIGDYRVNPEDPPLLGRFAALPLPSDALGDTYRANRFWPLMLQNFAAAHWPFVTSALFRTRGVDGDALIQRSRVMFVIVGVALGALIAVFSWQLAGATAAVGATALFCLDPNFIAHSAIIKNDVMLSLLMLALSMAVWRFGRRGTWWNLAAIALICAVAVNVKFSGVMFGPFLLVLLLIRGLIPQPWAIFGRALTTRSQRLLVAPAVCAGVGMVCYVAIWASYGFRFAPTDDPSQRLNTELLLARTRHDLIVARTGSEANITPAMVMRQPPGLLPNLLVFAEDHYLLPQAWINGFLYTYTSTLYRAAYLLGEIRLTGWWYYFPLAMLFKTPVATLAVWLVYGGFGIWLVIRRWRQRGAWGWTAACLIVPVGMYVFSAMTSNINLGIRHALPVYPLLYVTCGVVFQRIVTRFGSRALLAASLLFVILIIETLSAWPNYIAFFNRAVGGTRNGIHLLADSNLDWGQDLKTLRQWQVQHPDTPLAFGPLYSDEPPGSYFGTADPAAYGIVATPLGAADVEALKQTHVLAISASLLQGVYGKQFASYRDLPPTEVLGGTIYLYDLRPGGGH
jgi:hypothetical protein